VISTISNDNRYGSRQQFGRQGGAFEGGQLPAIGSEPLLITGAAGALKSRFTDEAPHVGHAGFSSPRISNSNSLLQGSHWYSKIGTPWSSRNFAAPTHVETW
jgi:hypothetical protein